MKYVAAVSSTWQNPWTFVEEFSESEIPSGPSPGTAAWVKRYPGETNFMAKVCDTKAEADEFIAQYRS